MARTPNPEKAAKYEAKGDKAFEKEKFKKALKFYRKSHEFDPDNPEIYEKLTKAHDKLPGDWKQKDFAESVSWTMIKQELTSPHMRQTHAKLTPEWKEAMDTMSLILTAESEEKEHELIERLVDMGEIATRALAGFMVDMKNTSKTRDEERGTRDE